MLKRSFKGLFVLGLASGVGGSASAASFQLQEQNTKDLGTAYAGAASLAEDASTAFYNPAGLTNLEKENVVISTALISAKLKATLTTVTNNAGTNQAGVPGDVKEKSDPHAIPGLHFSSRLTDKIVVGFSVESPYGLSTSYGEDSLMRYMATDSSIRTIEFSPNVGYALTDKFSVGLGWDFMRAKAAIAAKFSLAPAVAGDYNFRVKGSDNTNSFHIGLLYKLSDNTQIGLTFYNQFSLHFSGYVNNDYVAAPTTNQLGTADLRLPTSFRYSVTHRYNDKWKLLADVQWTNWAVLEDFIIKYNNDAGAPQETRLIFRYRNTMRYAIGAHYVYNDKWLLKLGAAYDQTPTTAANFLVRLPDSNRVWASFGARYSVTDSFTIDGGYSYLFLKKMNVQQGPDGAAAPQLNRVDGRGKAKVHIMGVQLTWNLV